MVQEFFIGIEPTNACNLRCVHCLRADKDQTIEMELDVFSQLIEQTRVYGKPHIALTGGEPTLHTCFFDLLSIIAKAELTCNLVTNGQNFEDILSDLKKFQATVPYLAFSIDGAQAETHDAIRGPGSFRRVTMAAALARYKGFRVTLQCAINRKNRQELRLLPELAHNLGAHALYLCHTQPTPELYARGWQLSPKEWLEIEGEVRDLYKSALVPKPQLSLGASNWGALAPCLALQNTSLNIDYLGRLTLCCQLSGTGSPQDTIQPTDVIADLKEINLLTAHKRLLPLVSEVVRERLALLEEGSTASLDAFPCWYCLKRFRKVDWLKAYPDDAWVVADPYFSKVLASEDFINAGFKA